jgi:uncharacterized protein
MVKKNRWNWRPWLRAIHRDMGYVAVGLTLIYAFSGLAVNHLSDWDPNFQNYESTHEIGGPLTGDDQKIAQQVLSKLKITDKPTEVYRASDEELEVLLKRRSLHINTKTGHITDEGRKPRMLLRAANWLHLNRGKKAWTYVADSYAAALLLLALSGLFMIPGRKGLRGRGAALALLGIAIPIVYLQISGGPDAHSGTPSPPKPMPGSK